MGDITFVLSFPCSLSCSEHKVTDKINDKSNYWPGTPAVNWTQVIKSKSLDQSVITDDDDGLLFQVYSFYLFFAWVSALHRPLPIRKSNDGPVSRVTSWVGHKRRNIAELFLDIVYPLFSLLDIRLSQHGKYNIWDDNYLLCPSLDVNKKKYFHFSSLFWILIYTFWSKGL